MAAAQFWEPGNGAHDEEQTADQIACSGSSEHLLYRGIEALLTEPIHIGCHGEEKRADDKKYGAFELRREPIEKLSRRNIFGSEGEWPIGLLRPIQDGASIEQEGSSHVKTVLATLQTFGTFRVQGLDQCEYRKPQVSSSADHKQNTSPSEDVMVTGEAWKKTSTSYQADDARSYVDHLDYICSSQILLRQRIGLPIFRLPAPGGTRKATDRWGTADSLHKQVRHGGECPSRTLLL